MGAQKKYDKAAAKFSDAQNKYNSAVSKYTGTAGMKLATETAKDTSGQLAQQAASGATAAAQTAARGSGMSKAAAASLGTQNASNTYSNTYKDTFQNQQQTALNAGNAAVSGAAQNVDMAGSARESQMQRGQQRFGNTMNALGTGFGVVGSILSDERLKNYRLLSDKCVMEEGDPRVNRFNKLTEKLRK